MNSAKLFEQILREKDIKSILFNSNYSFSQATKLAFNQLGVEKIDNCYNQNHITVYNKDGTEDIYIRDKTDGLFYKAKLINYKRPIYKTIKVENPDYEPGEDRYSYKETDEILRYVDSTKYVIDTDKRIVCPQDIVDYCKYYDEASEYRRRIRNQSTKKTYVDRHNNDLRVERIPSFDYQEFESLEDSDDGTKYQEVWGTWKLFYKNNFLGYVTASGEYTFEVSSETTYHRAATYWDPAEDAGTATAVYSDGNLEFTFWEKELTLDEIEGEGPMDLETFLKLQPASIRPIIRKYLEEIIEKDLKFEEEETWDWSY
jgi:hypothetical protein